MINLLELAFQTLLNMLLIPAILVYCVLVFGFNVQIGLGVYIVFILFLSVAIAFLSRWLGNHPDSNK